MSCHHNSFKANTTVSRTRDAANGHIVYRAETTVQCAQCGEVFEYDGFGPRVNLKISPRSELRPANVPQSPMQDAVTAAIKH